MKLHGSEKVFFHKHYGIWARRIHAIKQDGTPLTFLLMWDGKRWSRHSFDAIKQLHSSNPSKFGNYDILERS